MVVQKRSRFSKLVSRPQDVWSACLGHTILINPEGKIQNVLSAEREKHDIYIQLSPS
jgi:hypothetical protein